MGTMFFQDIPPVPYVAPANETVTASAEWDMTVGLMNATVQLDQNLDARSRKVGTGFLISAPKPDGTPRTVLVTAQHVLNVMPSATARIGWRAQDAQGEWRFAPADLAIRDASGAPLWTRHPQRDIAVMEIAAPEMFANAAIPMEWLGDETTLERWRFGPGDELMALGFPHGLSSNRAGFPILRLGRISSYPLTPISQFNSFLLDFSVSQGNSGGPVFWVPAARRPAGAPIPEHPYIAGVLVQ